MTFAEFREYLIFCHHSVFDTARICPDDERLGELLATECQEMVLDRRALAVAVALVRMILEELSLKELLTMAANTTIALDGYHVPNNRLSPQLRKQLKTCFGDSKVILVKLVVLFSTLIAPGVDSGDLEGTLEELYPEEPNDLFQQPLFELMSIAYRVLFDDWV